MQTNVTVINTDDGWTEIQWGRGNSDTAHDGYIQITPGGTVIFPFRRPADDEPLMLAIGEEDGTVRIYHTEDAPPNDAPLVFDSNALNLTTN